MSKKLQETCEITSRKTVAKDIEITIDDDLRKWLDTVGEYELNIEAVQGYLSISGWNTISRYQEGYLGKDWESSWIVFAQCFGADPLIYNTDTKEILTAMHGCGVWEPYVISENFQQFDLMISKYCLLSKKYDENIFDEDHEAFSRSLLETFCKEVKEELLTVSDRKYVNGFLEFLAFP
jgi:hypothetical protein